MRDHDPRPLPVPQGRLNRALRTGGLVAGIVGRIAAQGARDAVTGRGLDARGLLFSPANARKITAELSRMRGAAMKMGQLLSMEGADLLAPEVAALLEPLRAQAHFMPPKQLKAALSAAWGSDFPRRFKQFDVHPIAAASIGQVHRATTLDGRVLAIKVQYPGVADAIDSDIDNLRMLLRLPGVVPSGVDLDPLMEDARQQLHEEADYAREAQMMARFHGALSDRFDVPRPDPEFSTGQVLAMDFIPGVPLATLERAPQDLRNQAVQGLIDLTLAELFDLRLMQTDPNLANFLFNEGTGRVALLDFGATRAFSETFVDRHRSLLRAALSESRAESAQCLKEIGYLPSDLEPSLEPRLLDLFEMAMAPIKRGGLYDFAQCTLAEDLRKAGLDLAQERIALSPPPADAVFLQRKIAGLYLIAKRFSAQVDMDAVLRRAP